MFLISSQQYKIEISDRSVRDEFCELPRETRKALISSCREARHTSASRIRKKSCLTSRIKTDTGLMTFGVAHKHSVAIVFCIHNCILTILAIRRFLRRGRIVIDESFNCKKKEVYLQIAALPATLVWDIDNGKKRGRYTVPVNPKSYYPRNLSDYVEGPD